MIIDFHTQVWLSPEQLGPDMADGLRRAQAARWDQYDASTAAHEEAMGCVDGSAVLGFRSSRLGAHIPNEFIAAFVNQRPHRRIGIAGIDPLDEDADQQFDTALALGLSGVTVSPACQGFHPAHSAAMRLYERCADAGLPVVATLDGPFTAAVEMEFARPGHWDEVARAFPSLRLVMGQLGHPWIDETLFLLGKHEHVYADLADVSTRPWQLYQSLLNAVSFGVIDKLIFGSGFPRTTPAKAIETLYSVNKFSQGTQLPVVPRAQIRGIIERDCVACLGLDGVLEPTDHTRDPESDLEIEFAQWSDAHLNVR